LDHFCSSGISGTQVLVFAYAFLISKFLLVWRSTSCFIKFKKFDVCLENDFIFILWFFQNYEAFRRFIRI
jgi:hypothetical protein